jgi:hypothetical protein
MVSPNRGPARLMVLAYGGTPGAGCVVEAVRMLSETLLGKRVDWAKTGALTPRATIKQAMRFIRNLLWVTYAPFAQESCERG